MTILIIIFLAVIQGLAELLPVSSSAHVVVAMKLLKLDPAAPEMTFLLVMLHTGTMFAVIAYFWNAWKKSFFASTAIFKMHATRLILATLLTGAVGYPLMKIMEHLAGKMGDVAKDAAGHYQPAEIESLFGNLELISIALACVGILILIAGLSKRSRDEREIANPQAAWIGAVQGLSLPFRGFSRSGSTISVGLLLGCAKARVEEFSFALAVILTPAVIGRELLRLIKSNAQAAKPLHFPDLITPGILGLIFSFLAGLLALSFLSRILEKGRWHLFGFYCLAASVVVFVLYLKHW